MSEAELITKAQQGDRTAFRMLVQEWQGFVYSIAFRFMGNQSDAEDLVQDAFVKLWSNLGKYKPDMRMKPWLGKIVTNLCIDHLKSAKIRQSRNTVELEKTMGVSDGQTPHKLIDQAELQDVIRSLASKLTPRQQSVFVLRDLEELEVDEVTQMLDISADVVKSNLYHARIKIKEGLQAYYGERTLNLDQKY